jgi:hypothetical protein
MLRRIAWLALLALCFSRAEAQRANSRLVGTWRLISRTDSAMGGVLPADGPLGADPVAILVYDDAGNVSAQLMSRHRSGTVGTESTATALDPNNSAASGGYDAYFGRYAVDSVTGTVTHQLIGALAPEDVGRRLTRHYELVADTLCLWFETRRTDGQRVRRRLRWQRVAR